MSARNVIDARDLAGCVADAMGVCTDCPTSDADVREPKPCPACGTGLMLPLMTAVALGFVEVERDPAFRGALLDRVIAGEKARLFRFLQ